MMSAEPHWSRYHPFAGSCTRGTLSACVYSSLHEWTRPPDTGTPTRTAVRVLVVLDAFAIVAIYLLGFYLRRSTFKGKGRRGERANADAQSSDESVGENDKDAITAAIQLLRP
ncbi:hypothetical protein CALVIDRAFT_357602 [Calocera viscosa TUFC12733]|uniref:Uncharacterized protein n=1 Tax=Calocera viscosa (strain TUFC12733) TaxID=1330018 RepID=A0A167QFH9_CALVF|nr:hypothetical protein CALVIDRAFT_357602 [Calocera viscosa TUFC12733]